MVDVKPVEQARRTLSELVRGLVYPVVPILGVACVWAYAYAGSLESKLERDQRPRDAESYVSHEMAERRNVERQTDNHPLAGIHVTSVDDQH
jgi:hypothetical protein